MADIIITGKEEIFQLCPLKEEDISYTLDACDKFVGKNLYTKKDLEEAINEGNRYFWILETSKGEFAGYIYYYLTDVESIAKDAKLSTDAITKVCGNRKAIIGKIQSSAVVEKFRGAELAFSLINYATEQLYKLNADYVFIICWKKGEKVPLAKSCIKCGYKFLTESKNVWYDLENMICPYCNGRCRCSAHIYYKNLKGENILEKEN